MKEEKIAIMAWTVMLSASVFADVYYNNKTFTESESTEGNVYIGHASAESGSSNNALVTVDNGTWTIGAFNLYLGNSPGISRLNIEEDGKISSTGYMYIGAANDVSGVVTNRGEVSANFVHLAPGENEDKNFGKNFRSAKFDNYGKVTAVRNLSIGLVGDGKGDSVFYNHENAILDVQRNDQYGFYIGGRSPGTLINEGSVVCHENCILRIGGALTSKGLGTLIMTNNASFVSCKTVRVGENKGNAVIKLYGDSLFDGTTKGGSTVSIAYSENTKAEVLLYDNSKLTAKNIYIGNGKLSEASLTLDGNSSLEFETIAIARGEASKGTLKLDGETEFTLPAAFAFPSAATATGMIYVAGNSCLTIDGSSDRIHICGDANRNAYLKVQDEARLVVSNINVAFPWQSKANMCGVLEIADSGIVSNVSFMGIGRGSTSSGLVKMNGGTLMLNSKLAELNSIQIGSNGSFTDGRITGWGRIAFDDPQAIMVDYANVLQRTTWGSMTLCGQIVADGGILDFSRGPTPQYTGSAYNTSGTNGYYAVNKGMLKFPRSLPRLKNTHKMVGIMPDYQEPLMVNTFQYTFDDMNVTGTYVFSELYATDRSDIPAGLPTGKGIHHSAVWRIGHFNASATPDVDDEDLTADHKQNFSSLKLKFHYDPALAEIEGVRHVKVYRCTDSVNGGWTCVASITAPDAASPYIETVEFAPSSELWNGGWFAIVGTPKVGTVMVLR